MSKMKLFLKQHGLVVLLVTLVLMILILGVMILAPRNHANLAVSVAPVDADVLINGQAYENGMFRNMAPGHYTAVISRNGFGSKTVEFDLKNGEIVYLNEYLTQPELGFDYYETDKDSLLVLREYLSSHEGDGELKVFLEDYDRKKSVRDILPLEYEDEVTGGFYLVDFREESPACKKSYCLAISTSDDIYWELALTALRIQKYNPEDYEIIDVSDRCD